jgi:hypothetical protein
MVCSPRIGVDVTQQQDEAGPQVSPHLSLYKITAVSKTTFLLNTEYIGDSELPRSNDLAEALVCSFENWKSRLLFRERLIDLSDCCDCF